LGWPWGGFGVPMRCLSTGFEVALRWLWCGFVLRSLCLVYAYYMALGWLWVACRPSLFKVRGSTFDVRRSASARNLKCSKAAGRPGGGLRRPRWAQSYLRRVSGETPMSLLGSQRRFGLCNWGCSAPLVARRACRPELRIEWRLGTKPDCKGAVARGSGVGPGAVPCGSRKALIARHLRR